MEVLIFIAILIIAMLAAVIGLGVFVGDKLSFYLRSCYYPGLSIESMLWSLVVFLGKIVAKFGVAILLAIVGVVLFIVLCIAAV